MADMALDAEPVIFDSRFIVTATSIGVIYTLIVLVVNAVVGSAQAGVAGVALTALATGLFQRFASLKFRSIADNEITTLSLRKFNVAYFACTLFAFFGIQAFIGSLHRTINQLLGMGDSSELAGQELVNWLLQAKIVIPMIVLTALAHFLAGVVVARTAGSSAYLYSGSSSFGSNLLGLALGLPAIFMYPHEVLEIVKPNLLYGSFWLIYLATALLGVRMGRKTTKTRQQSL